MFVRDLRTRSSNIIWSIDTDRPHKAIVQVSGNFPIEKIQNLLNGHILKQKYRAVFEDVLEKYPDGILPEGYEVYNYCAAGALSKGLQTCNGNMEFILPNGMLANSVLEGTNPTDVLAFVRKKIAKSILRYSGSITRLWVDAVSSLEPRCIISGITDRERLQAAHIKPRAIFPSAKIALNENNGFMVERSLHSMFDAGRWSIKDGEVVLSSKLSQQEKNFFNTDLKIDTKVLEKKEKFFNWHHKNIFKR
jgi:hypothetical protein